MARGPDQEVEARQGAGRRARSDSAQTKELLRRLADSSDPRRYLIISRMLPSARFILYYNVSDDVYAWNDPEGGTLFKRRKAAELIQRKLGRGNEVIEVKKVRGKVIGAPRRRPRARSAKPHDE